MKIEMAKYRIKDICHLEKGQQIDTDLLDDSNRYRYVNGGIEASGNYGEYNTVGKTIMVSEGGASCGYVNYTEEPFWCGCHCYKLTGISVNPRYLFFALKANQTKIMGLRTGSAMPNIKKSLFEEFELSLSGNESEQIHVVEVLDKIGNLIDQRKSQIKYFDELLRARFVEMFGTLHDNQNEFDVVNIEDVCSLIKDGTHQTPQYTEDKKNGYKFLSSKDVMSQKIDWSDIKYIPVELHEKLYATVKPQRNDILMSKNGVNYGVAAVNDTDDIFDIYVSLALLRPKEMIAPVFFRCVINNPETKRQFDSSIKGIGVPNLHLGEIKKTKVFLPPMELQRKFVDFVHQVDKSKLSFHLTRYELRR